MKKKSKILFLVLAIAMIATCLFGCADNSRPSPATGPGSDPGSTSTELTKVSVGLTPYPMYTVFSVAKELGIDQKFGLDLDLKTFTGTAQGAQALTRGDVQISAACIAEHLAAVSGSPTLTNFAPLGNFKGFFFVGREDEWTPWDDLVEECGGDIEKAKEQRLLEFEGKIFCVIPQRHALILDAISQVGLTEDDVTFMDFGDDAKAASAILSGTGDLYIGSLPQQRSLVAQGGYVDVGGSDILGPAGLWFDSMMTTDAFMTENRETALRLYAVMFASIAAFDSDPDAYSEIAARLYTETSGVETPTEEWKTFMTEFDDLVSLDEAKEGFYNPDNRLYWANAVDYNIELLVSEGSLKEGVTGEQYYGESEKLFNELLTRDDLVKLINSTTMDSLK